MSVGGISGGGGHIGAAESTRRANTLSNIGSAAFNTLVSAGTVAAGAFGGPAAASAVSSMRGLAGSVGASDIDGQVANISQDISNNTNSALSAEGQRSQEDFSRQLALFSLQRSVNSQSQTANMIANMQKARHDAMMATISNTR